jgi:hypothetical protein
MRGGALHGFLAEILRGGLARRDVDEHAVVLMRVPQAS